jgi:hypothetical protein
MSYTKLELVKSALSEIGLSSYMFDLSSDQLSEALTRLDAMMAEWNGRGLRLGYPIASSPGNINASDDSGIPDWSYEAVITNLAIRIAPAYGKTVSRETSITATRGINTIFARSAKPREMRLGPLPAGAGAKSTAPFLPILEKGIIEHADDTAEFE